MSKKGFRKPILVEKKDGLGMVVPDSGFSIGDVQKFVGKSKLHTDTVLGLILSSIVLP